MKSIDRLIETATRRFGKDYSKEKQAYISGYIEALEETQDLMRAIYGLEICQEKVRTPNAEFMGCVQKVLDEYKKTMKDE